MMRTGPIIRRVFLLSFALLFLNSSAVLAEDRTNFDGFILGAPYYKPNPDETASKCSASTPTSTTGSPSPAGQSNLDYAGRRILTDAQLQAIKNNQPVYEEAAKDADIPWQMIAVIHIRETGLSRENPSNGQGIYQIASGAGGPYPQGPVSDKEFLRQTKFAANFIKNSAGSNYAAHKKLTAGSDAETVKDTFFSYNGRASAYEQQAASLEFDPKTQGYEGSPYVMNKADAQRDPEKNPTGWGQIKRDHGPIEYPANGDYGAFVQYAALTGTGLGGSCATATGPARQQIVSLAQEELRKWESGQLKPGTGFHIYSQNRNENWCADFASWIYNKAGVPLADGNNGNVPAVDTIRSIGERGGKFVFHPSAGYKPQPGDLAIHQGPGVSHVNIVVGVSGNKITTIGGNQGGDGRQGAYYQTSSVTQYTITGASSDDIVGYVGPAQ